MSNSKSKTAFDKLKYEIAKETGVNLKEGYNGDLTSREAGTIGGNIVRKVFESYTAVSYTHLRKAGSARSDDTGVSGNGRNQYHDFGGLFFCGTGALVYKGINFNVKRS